MATIAAVRAAHATLTTTTVDTVNLAQEDVALVNVYNRAGTADLTVTFGVSGSAVTPVALAAETYLIPSGKALTVALERSSSQTTQVKVLGDGNAYSVQVLQ